MSTDAVHMPSAGSMPADHVDVAMGGIVEEDDGGIVEVPSTPLQQPQRLAAVETSSIPASQDSLLSTQPQAVPASPLEEPAPSIPTELNDDSDDGASADAADRRPAMIPSSLTPPPAPAASVSQTADRPPLPAASRGSQRQSAPPGPSKQNTTSYVNLTSSSQRSMNTTATSAILSPPDTGLRRDNSGRRGSVGGAVNAAASSGNGSASAFKAPSPEQIAAAAPDELRAMLQASLAEQTRLQTETAHYKLQYNLLCLQADDDAQRAAVEYEMTRREVEALRTAESARQARRELGSTSAAESSQAKYAQLKMWYDELADENEALQTRVRLAKRVIQQKDDEVAALVDEKELLLNRLRENREHFHLLCSPGGLFHGAMTPKQQQQQQQQQQQSLAPPATAPIGSTSPAVHGRSAAAMTTPYQTPTKARTTHGARLGGGSGAGSHGRDAEPMAALLQALSQEHHSNTSAPSTPYGAGGSGPRTAAVAASAGGRRYAPKHVRNAQSLSSLPTTPTHRLAASSMHAGGAYGGVRGGGDLLLPSVDLVPQTEPRLLARGGAMGGAASTGRAGHGYSLSSVSARGGDGFDRAVFPTTPTPVRRRRQPLPDQPMGGRSRESTISADDEDEGDGNEAVDRRSGSGTGGGSSAHNEALARQALDSVVAAAAAAAARLDPAGAAAAADEPVYESQASLAASAMLRRDARESFEVASSSAATSRQPTPVAGGAATAEKSSAKLQAKLFGGISKGPGVVASAAAGDKRKFGESAVLYADGKPDNDHNGDSNNNNDDDAGLQQGSPPKKARLVPSLREPVEGYRQQVQQQAPPPRVGLGIRYD